MIPLSLCPRKSVGAIVMDSSSKKHLCLYRKVPPVGLAGIAGHLDFIDEEKQVLETPFQALRREAREESGIIIISAHLVMNKTLPSIGAFCSSADGERYTGHEWFVYDVCCYTGIPKLMEPDKHQFVKFMTFDEIMKYILYYEVDPAWLYIWTHFGLAKALH